MLELDPNAVIIPVTTKEDVTDPLLIDVAYIVLKGLAAVPMSHAFGSPGSIAVPVDPTYPTTIFLLNADSCLAVIPPSVVIVFVKVAPPATITESISVELTVSFPENLPDPVTSRATVGLRLLIPTRRVLPFTVII